MALKTLNLRGTPNEQGVAHGRDLRDDIRANLAVYYQRFENEVGLAREQVRERAAIYARYLATAHPDYLAAMEGVAAGAAVDFMDVVVLNVRYEIIYSALSESRTTDGCTAFALAPDLTQTCHQIMGQNWDWIPEVRGAVVRSADARGPSLGFTEAGIVGAKIGLNIHGVGLAINGMNSVDDDWSRLALPFHVRCYEILRARTLADAIAVVTNGARSCSTNFVVGQAGRGALDIEAAPNGTCTLGPEAGVLVHANHFEAADAIGVKEAPYERRPFSIHRRSRLTELLETHAPHSIEGLQAILRDHEGFPDSVCRHPSLNEPAVRPYKTVVSVIMDLDARAMWISDGSPCENAHTAFNLQEIPQGNRLDAS